MDQTIEQTAEAKRTRRAMAPEPKTRDGIRISMTIPHDAYGRLLAEAHIRRMSPKRINELVTELIYDNCKGFISRGRGQVSTSGRANPDVETLTMGETLTSPPAPIEGGSVGAGESSGDVAETARSARRKPRQSAA